jgi:hypothetical protein
VIIEMSEVNEKQTSEVANANTIEDKMNKDK